MKKILCLVLLLATFPAVTISVAAEREQPKLSHTLMPVQKVIKASDFTLPDMDEEPVKFSDYRGKVVLLNFWATWCPPCIREMPSLERLHLQISEEKFAVIAINQMEDSDQVFAFTGQLSIDPTFQILLDTSSKVSQAYAVRGLPTTYLIDKKGHIRYRAVGGREFDHPEVVKIINQLIAE